MRACAHPAHKPTDSFAVSFTRDSPVIAAGPGAGVGAGFCLPPHAPLESDSLHGRKFPIRMPCSAFRLRSARWPEACHAITTIGVSPHRSMIATSQSCGVARSRVGSQPESNLMMRRAAVGRSTAVRGCPWLSRDASTCSTGWRHLPTGATRRTGQPGKCHPRLPAARPHASPPSSSQGGRLAAASSRRVRIAARGSAPRGRPGRAWVESAAMPSRTRCPAVA